MRLCSYIVKHDRGLAPNPFWGYCTLAVCTPNHMGIKLQKRDWIIGFSSKKRGNKLVYAMQVSEVLRFDDYFSDVRFEKKKPDINGSWKEKCGDNFYFRNSLGKWEQYPTHHHRDEVIKDRDLKHPYVFIARDFYYFGENAELVPTEFQSLILDHRGCKCDQSPEIAENFILWVTKNFEPGIHGNPKDISVGCIDVC